MAAGNHDKRAFARRPPLIPALLFLSAAASWFWLELAAWKGYDGSKTGTSYNFVASAYNWQVETLSDLGIIYRQVHPLKHYNVTSHRAPTQNFNFMLNGALFAAAQLALVSAGVGRRWPAVKVARALLALLYAGGLVLMAQVHGGPREKHWGTVGWHWTGYALAAVAGSVSSILAGVVPKTTDTFRPGVVYQALSVLLGLVGLYSLWQFETLGKWNYQTKVGLWQRLPIYSVQAWQIMTAVTLLIGWRADSSKVRLQ